MGLLPPRHEALSGARPVGGAESNKRRSLDPICLRVILGVVTKRRGENGGWWWETRARGNKDSLYLLDTLLRPFEIALGVARYFDAFREVRTSAF